MTDVADQLEDFKKAIRPRVFGKGIQNTHADRSGKFVDDKVFVDSLGRKHLGSDELLAQFEAVGLDSEFIAKRIKAALDNKKISLRDQRMLISQVLGIIEQSEGKKITVKPGDQDRALLQAQLEEVVGEIEQQTGQPMERLKLVNGPCSATPDSESGGAEGADRRAERGSPGDLPAATEG